MPDRITVSCAGRADAGAAVVAIHPPGVHDTLHVALVSGTPDVVNHLVLALLLNRFADFGGDFVQHLIPTDALPAALAAFALTLKGVEDAVGVGDLVDRRRTLRTVAAPASRVVGVAFKFAGRIQLAINVVFPTDAMAIKKQLNVGHNPYLIQGILCLIKLIIGNPRNVSHLIKC